mmetsp:Transcript_126329/g.218899  ORF Transcript_126329/g.218899 Transcript_126329/m.218899 type:complete len:142 (-) Transcript_126329:370-795(-)
MKAEWPLRTEKLDKKHNEPSVKSNANFCGANTIIGRKPKAKLISMVPRKAYPKKYDHVLLEIATSDMLVEALLATFPALLVAAMLPATALCTPFCAAALAAAVTPAKPIPALAAAVTPARPIPAVTPARPWVSLPADAVTP